MRIGIIGTGRIASRFADTAFAGIESAYVSCVYNPKAESAEKFAIQHRIENYTGLLYEKFKVFFYFKILNRQQNLEPYLDKLPQPLLRRW